jgi:hypothetical protein
VSRPPQSTPPDQKESTSIDLERDAAALRKKMLREFATRRDSRAQRFYDQMKFHHETLRVMWLYKHSISYRSKPEFDIDDLYAARVLREEIGQHLKLFCQEISDLMKWLIENLALRHRDIAWIEREAEKIWPMIEKEYPIWTQIACYGRPAQQEWQAPGWLDKWPEELAPKALLSAARGGRLNAHRTAKVLKEVRNRVEEKLTGSLSNARDEVRIQIVEQKPAARQAATAEPLIEPQQKPPAAKQVQFTPREQKIWEVIQRGLSGPLYCRELKNAGVGLLRTGVWKDCPAGTYPAAYLLGEPWCHRIQDEKSKIKRKAKLAKTLASE